MSHEEDPNTIREDIIKRIREIDIRRLKLIYQYIKALMA